MICDLCKNQIEDTGAVVCWIDQGGMLTDFQIVHRGHREWQTMLNQSLARTKSKAGLIELFERMRTGVVSLRDGFELFQRLTKPNYDTDKAAYQALLDTYKFGEENWDDLKKMLEEE